MDRKDRISYTNSKSRRNLDVQIDQFNRLTNRGFEILKIHLLTFSVTAAFLTGTKFENSAGEQVSLVSLIVDTVSQNFGYFFVLLIATGLLISSIFAAFLASRESGHTRGLSGNDIMKIYNDTSPLEESEISEVHHTASWIDDLIEINKEKKKLINWSLAGFLGLFIVLVLGFSIISEVGGL
ncbi:hypothetical protein [Haloferax sp. Atlit-4N]|uniref:hypothetical protein n=1 Tax=Haloferax sp. Atlit-4N TaxID=2077206 RepID=UPI0011C02A28|nr:hypothetical protein [Haloferax sp. Atlit-4N]